ncbi:hypothetical protein SAMN05216223_111119 [Actinacidiphila yanglinensis]|uniref:Uncharacterized protein n=1 Tax=Actinacidiphila yanglinensis TaxID=310779 RepID=A0A1H6D1X4_9ACTN|nr:hypothetical protein [Actinacidiphila yanglinensis]SEG79240.1 hypothetical protein SAMN05216223_111119 [Actinacidiphila yanglinensis]
MKRYVIHGREGLDLGPAPGPIAFGQRRAEVTALLGDDPAVFRMEGRLRDYFHRWSLNLSYDDAERLEFVAVELGPEVHYRGVPLLGPPYEDVHAELTALGLHGVEGKAGIAFNDLGFAVLGAPDDPLVHTWGVEIYPPGTELDLDDY